MKANQAFKANDEAVSPVIGVILMVAITVVLAAVVFVLVSNLSKNSNSSSPNLSLQVDGTKQRINVISAASGADWSRLSIVATACTGATAINIGGTTAPHQNVAATAAASTAISSSACTGTNTPVKIASTASVINAGDFLSFCGAAATATNVNIQVVDTVANSQVGQFTLPTVSQCA